MELFFADKSSDAAADVARIRVPGTQIPLLGSERDQRLAAMASNQDLLTPAGEDAGDVMEVEHEHAEEPGGASGGEA